jgi:hypothetical protein
MNNSKQRCEISCVTPDTDFLWAHAIVKTEGLCKISSVDISRHHTHVKTDFVQNDNPPEHNTSLYGSKRTFGNRTCRE